MWAIMRSSPRVCVPANVVSDLIFLLGTIFLRSTVLDKKGYKPKKHKADPVYAFRILGR